MLAPSNHRESGLSSDSESRRSPSSGSHPALTLITGDVTRGALDAVDNGSIQTVVTSPPYFGVPRDYLPLGARMTQLGVEHSFALYKEGLLKALIAVQPKLARDGWIWMNLGDQFYSRRGCGPQGKNGIGNHTERQGGVTERIMEAIDGVKNKDIIGVPYQIATAARNELGYFWRASIPWVKVETYGESVRDRPVVSIEWIIGLSVSKSPKYDRLAVQLPGKTQSYRMRRTGDWFYESLDDAIDQLSSYLDHLRAVRDGGSGLFSTDGELLAVSVLPGGYSGHKAAFPENLVAPLIESTTEPGDLVGDIFGGSGTTGVAALRRDRRALLVDIRDEYLSLSLGRIRAEIGDVSVREFTEKVAA